MDRNNNQFNSNQPVYQQDEQEQFLSSQSEHFEQEQQQESHQLYTGMMNQTATTTINDQQPIFYPSDVDQQQHLHQGPSSYDMMQPMMSNPPPPTQPISYIPSNPLDQPAYFIYVPDGQTPPPEHRLSSYPIQQSVLTATPPVPPPKSSNPPYNPYASSITPTDSASQTKEPNTNIANYVHEYSSPLRSPSVDNGNNNNRNSFGGTSVNQNKFKKKRYCCGCFATRRACCCFWLFFFILIAASIGIAVYMLWPRISKIDISDPFVQDNNNLFSTNGNPLTASSSAPFSLSLNFASNVSVKSESYVDYQVSDISVKGNVLDNNKIAVKGLEVTGTKKDAVIQKQAITNFMFPLTLNYSMTSSMSQINQDPVLNLLISKCGTDQRLDIQIETILTIPLISWTGYKPSIMRTTTMECPAQAVNILRQLANSGNIVNNAINTANNAVNGAGNIANSATNAANNAINSISNAIGGR